MVLAAEGPHRCLPCLCGGDLRGRAAHRLPPPHSFCFSYCSLPILAPFVINSFILMCECLSMPLTGRVETGESGGTGYSGEASSAPLISPLPSATSSLPLPGHFIPLGSSGLAPTLRPSLPISQPSGGLLPGGSCFLSRAAYSLLQLQRVPCILRSLPGQLEPLCLAS